MLSVRILLDTQIIFDWIIQFSDSPDPVGADRAMLKWCTGWKTDTAFCVDFVFQVIMKRIKGMISSKTSIFLTLL